MKKKNKHNSILLQVPDPCSESWDAMTPLPGGRYCSRCEKTVVDFSAMPEQDMLRYILQREGRVCGRFRHDQMNRPLLLHTPPSRWQQIRTAGALLAGLTLATGAAAQEVASKPPPPPPPAIECGYVELPWNREDEREINGYLTDDEGEAVISANIFVKGENGEPLPYGTVSDMDGWFQLKIPAKEGSFRLVFSCVGYETREFLLDEIQSSFHVSLKPATYDLPQIEVAAYRVDIEFRCYTMGFLAIAAEEIGAAEKKAAFPENVLLIGEVYPNPFLSELNVKLTAETDAATLFHLYSAAGHLVFAQAFDLPSGNHTVNLNLGGRKLPAGAYFLRISDARGEIRTKQVIKRD